MENKEVFMVFAGEAYYPCPDDWQGCVDSLDKAIEAGENLLKKGREFDYHLNWYAIYSSVRGPLKFEGSCYGAPEWEELDAANK